MQLAIICAFGFLIDGNYIVSFLSLLLRQSRDAKNFGGLQERTQRSLMDVHLAVIDELDEGVQIGESDVLQHDHGVLAWRALKDVKHFNSYPKCHRQQMSFFFEIITFFLFLFDHRATAQKRTNGMRSEK